MFHSVFQIFKIGVGPSSSHTMGPMTACAQFRFALRNIDNKDAVRRVRCILFGSLAFTGKGHATDRAVALGLVGFSPDDVDAEKARLALEGLHQDKKLLIEGMPPVRFSPETDIVFDYETTQYPHPNTLTLDALDADGAVIFSETYCSIGGGFVLTEEAYEASKQGAPIKSDAVVPYGFSSMTELLTLCQAEGLSLAEVSRLNECSLASEEEVNARLDTLIAAMNKSVDQGLSQSGELPGGLRVKRRARKIYETLSDPVAGSNALPHAANDWLCAYAMAVNEENAAGNQIVTAPTNGAAGVIPAVLRYYAKHLSLPDPSVEKLREFLLVASVVGNIIKERASISGAEVGCQGEVGSASAMAAAGLCAVLGGTNEQIENAAEIALEHHMGLTCDPVKGLVQVPCIERNGFGAIKAVTAASLALHGDGGHIMPLDNCIDAMRDTGREMSSKFKETSRGGLAVNLPEC